MGRNQGAGGRWRGAEGEDFLACAGARRGALPAQQGACGRCRGLADMVFLRIHSCMCGHSPGAGVRGRRLPRRPWHTGQPGWASLRGPSCR